MGLSTDELYDLTLREYIRKLEGFNELRIENYKSQMEAARLTAAIVVQMFSKERIVPKDVFPFSWENESQDTYIMSVEDFEKRCKAWNII